MRMDAVMKREREVVGCEKKRREKTGGVKREKVGEMAEEEELWEEFHVCVEQEGVEEEEGRSEVAGVSDANSMRRVCECVCRQRSGSDCETAASDEEKRGMRVWCVGIRRRWKKKKKEEEGGGEVEKEEEEEGRMCIGWWRGEDMVCCGDGEGGQRR